MLPFFDPQPLQLWLSELGPWASLVFLALQVLQVLLFWLPADVFQMAAGMVFGVWYGTFLNIVGVTLGNVLAFLLARRLGKVWIEGWLSKHHFSRFQNLIHHPRLDLILGGVFLLPFLPKDILCYFAGLSDLKLWRFVWVTTLARLPTLLFSTWVGAASVQGLGTAFLVVTGVGAAVLLALFLYRNNLLALLVRQPVVARR